MRSNTLVNDTSPFRRLGKVEPSQEGTGGATGDDVVDRRLKQGPPGYCDDFRFEFAIDGVITSWDKDEFGQHVASIQRVVEVVTIVEDPELTNGGEEREIEFAVRMFGCGTEKEFQLTHVYWA